MKNASCHQGCSIKGEQSFVFTVEDSSLLVLWEQHDPYKKQEVLEPCINLYKVIALRLVFVSKKLQIL